MQVEMECCANRLELVRIFFVRPQLRLMFRQDGLAGYAENIALERFFRY